MSNDVLYVVIKRITFIFYINTLIIAIHFTTFYELFVGYVPIALQACSNDIFFKSKNSLGALFEFSRYIYEASTYPIIMYEFCKYLFCSYYFLTNDLQTC